MGNEREKTMKEMKGSRGRGRMRQEGRDKRRAGGSQGKAKEVNATQWLCGKYSEVVLWVSLSL